jgi:chromosome segregation ATPase
VQQGKIAEISQMSENELYLLLEDTAGVKRFMKKSE